MVATLMFSALGRAQLQEISDNSAIEVARANSRAARSNIVGSAMNLSDKEAAAFWPVYRQYEYERAKLEDSRVAVIKEYSDKYPKLTDAEAKSMAERIFEYESHLTALKKTYFKKFNKSLPGLTVTKFFQLDRRIDLLADMNLESALPPLTQAGDATVTQPQDTQQSQERVKVFTNLLPKGENSDAQ
jgi:hypothetical protein